ncbi:MAG: hypothetical protein KDC94_12410, partial [Aequorivita sp.]|nr:hypothetical protein [Aequorivita sp.]
YGNLIENKDKGITNVAYNHLNLPTEINFATGGKIEYFYDASGIKLKKKVTDGSTITTTEYMDTSTSLSTGSFQYTNNVLDFFPHAEGYVKAISSSFGGGPTTFSFKYVFSYTDHLGNIRLKYAQDPSNGNAISILEEDHYYPYGLKHKGYSGSHLVFEGLGPGTGVTLTPVNPFLGDTYKYKFGGKEYDDTFNINTYDFGARNYDPALGRWMNIDPLAEQMRRHSPYNYAFDNPVYFIDPDGMMNLPFGGGDTGVVENSNTLVVTSFDGEENTLDSQIVSGSDNISIAKDGGKISTGGDNSSSEDHRVSQNIQKDYPEFAKLINETVPKILKNKDFVGLLKFFSGLSAEEIKSTLSAGSGPLIIAGNVGIGDFMYDKSSGNIVVDFNYLEAYKNGSHDLNTVSGIVNILHACIGILHEDVHYGNHQTGKTFASQRISTEPGDAFERQIMNIGSFPGQRIDRDSPILLNYVKNNFNSLNKLFKE